MQIPAFVTTERGKSKAVLAS